MSRRLTKLYLPSMAGFVKSFYNFSRISMKKLTFKADISYLFRIKFAAMENLNVIDQQD